RDQPSERRLARVVLLSRIGAFRFAVQRRIGAAGDPLAVAGDFACDRRVGADDPCGADEDCCQFLFHCCGFQCRRSEWVTREYRDGVDRPYAGSLSNAKELSNDTQRRNFSQSVLGGSRETPGTFGAGPQPNATIYRLKKVTA